MRNRITLTASEAESECGRQLLNSILEMCHDGEITLVEVAALHSFLLRHPDSTIRAISFLRAKTRQIMADDALSRVEAYDLKQAFCRVAPVEARRVIETHLEAIGTPGLSGRSHKTRKRIWEDDPVTPAQAEYIINLGGQVDAGMTKGDASAIIESLLARRPPTPRQHMLLRFFDRLDLSSSTKEEVSEWIDHLFGDETTPACRSWERFKRMTAHDPMSLDIESVPIGACRLYQ